MGFAEKLGGEAVDRRAETGSGQTSSIRQVELIASYGYQAVALYMADMAFVTVISVVLATETFRSDIVRDQPEEQPLIVESPQAEVR